MITDYSKKKFVVQLIFHQLAKTKIGRYDFFDDFCVGKTKLTQIFDSLLQDQTAAKKIQKSKKKLDFHFWKIDGHQITDVLFF